MDRTALAALVLLGAAACSTPAEPPTDACTVPTEACLRAALGIPPEAMRVIVFSQSSPLDWDWTQTFDGSYAAWVDTAFSPAADLLAAEGAKDASAPPYFYSVAE